MNLSLYSAATGMEAQQLNLNTIANNLANVNTPGFKRSKIEFQDMLYQKPRASGSDSGGGNLVPTGTEVGNGARVAATSKVFTQGQLTATGEKLDLAIQGDEFFEIQRSDGTIGYTRDSSFKLNGQGQVVTVDGMPVLSGFQTVPPGGTVVTPEGAQSLGLEAMGVQQLRDGLLDRQVLRELALQAACTAEQSAFQRAQAGLGQSVDRSAAASAAGAGSGTGGLGAALDDYFNAFQSLASRPTDTGERQSLLQKSQILVDLLRQTDARLGQVQSDLDTQVTGEVGEINDQLARLAELNHQIGRAEIGRPGSAIDLRDQRQARLEELAALIPIETRPGTDGQIQVVMRDAADADVVLVDGSTVTGPVGFTGTGLTGGASATALVFSSGSIAGALAARDGGVQTLRDDLDNLARQLVTSVNAAYNPAATPGADYFDPAGLTAGTIGLAAGLTAAGLRSGTGAAGDNSLALAVAAVANRAFSTGSGDAIDGTLGQHYASAVSHLGQALASANARVNDQDSIVRLVSSQRDGISGVSLDEEMADLVRFQRAFQASSKVFSIVDDLLESVMNSLGR